MTPSPPSMLSSWRRMWLKPSRPCTTYQEVVLDIRAHIEEFKPYILLIQGLRNAGMWNRHWETLSNQININVRPKANLTFARCLKMNLQDHIESISKVAEVSGKEYIIEHMGSHQRAQPPQPGLLLWQPQPLGRMTVISPIPGVTRPRG
ncbi:dynein axonemal heavy chain 1-like isoform X2 [Pongo abelii]|uniref:dynein axonemal heavy chain 1-like isoform X2 n=1 Tax=Pongo abelii TaxID=9601 RepID=UPI0023E8517B|nr:dynein axonemal heavy chain 1-like isoform X2 [Pongo abelii]